MPTSFFVVEMREDLSFLGQEDVFDHRRIGAAHIHFAVPLRHFFGVPFLVTLGIGIPSKEVQRDTTDLAVVQLLDVLLKPGSVLLASRKCKELTLRVLRHRGLYGSPDRGSV